MSLPPIIFNLFKPAGVTSYDLIREVKKRLPKKSSIGHFGTLDPFASGILLVGIGQATRFNEMIHKDFQKTYLAIGKLGIKTDSGDREGEIVQTDDSPYLKDLIADFSLEFIDSLLKEKFIGEYFQAPPAFSAAKFQGKPLHEWARAGVMIQKEKVRREIYSIAAVKFSAPYLSIEVTASSGTYIRTLFEDIAKELGTFGHLIGLTRNKIGPFSLSESLKKSVLIDNEPSLYQLGRRVDDIFNYPRLFLKSEQEVFVIRNGNSLPCPVGQEGVCFVYSHDNDLVCYGKIENSLLRPLVNFHPV